LGTPARPVQAEIAIARPVRDGLLAALALFICACVAVAGLWLTTDASLRAAMDRRLITVARAAAALLDPEAHARLAERQGRDTELYERMITPLRQLYGRIDGVKFIYTTVLDGSDVRFILDPTPVGDADGDGVEDHSAPWDLYKGPDPLLVAILNASDSTQQVAVSKEPHTDQWGTYISAYQSLLSKDGRVAGVLGVDVDASEFASSRRAAHRAALLGLLPALAAAVLLGCFVANMQRRRLLQHRGKEAAELRFKVADERLRLLTGAVKDYGLFMLDVQGHVTTWNAGCAQLLQYTEDEILGKPQRVFHNADYQTMDWSRASLKLALQHGRFEDEGPRIRKDGSQFIANVVINPIFNDDGLHIGYSKIVRDITAWCELDADRERAARESDQAMQALERQTDELQRRNIELDLARASADAANRAKSEFLAHMSHELRTPLTAIIGFAELLSDETADAAQRQDCADTIRRSGEHLVSVINDILDLSKIEAGCMTIELLPCSPMDILTDIAALMQPKARVKGLDFKIDLPASLPHLVVSDPTRLRQIVLNLVSNAIKFTDAGAVKIAVDCEPVPGPASSHVQLTISVIDSGIGLDHDAIQRLFKPFTQADSSMNRRFGGTGLGLTISRTFARMLGGDIEVSSVPGKGSVFLVRMAVEVASQAAQTPPPAAQASASVPAQAKRLQARILLAEDGPDNQRLLSMFLKKAGAELTVVGDGQQALDALANAERSGTPYDLLLLDMQMPVLDGYQTAQAIRAQASTMPIVALTAHTMPEDRVKCLRAGCSHYLSKPVARDTLIDMCARALATRNAPVASPG